MNIKKEEKTVQIETYTIYNETFDCEKDAIEFKRKIEKKLDRTYYMVGINPDLSEGRGLTQKIIVSTPSKYDRLNTLYQFLLNQYGEPLKFVQGAIPTDNYSIYDTQTFDNFDTLNNFLNTQSKVGFGRFERNIKLNHITLNKFGEISE